MRVFANIHRQIGRGEYNLKIATINGDSCRRCFDAHTNSVENLLTSVTHLFSARSTINSTSLKF